MKHIVGLLAVVLTLTAWEEVAQAQHPAKIPRLGFLFFGRGMNLIWNHFTGACEI